MSIFDLGDYFNGEMDEWIEKYNLFDTTFKKGVCSVLLVDPDNQMSIKDYPSQNPDLDLKYIDFSECRNGDYALIEKKIMYGGYKGFVFDNIDEIGWIDDKADLEYLIKNSLKRDQLPFTDSIIDFGEVMVVCRCKKIPEYLNGKSLQMIIIGV